jgi:hypothetical protein
VPRPLAAAAALLAMEVAIPARAAPTPAGAAPPPASSAVPAVALSALGLATGALLASDAVSGGAGPVPWLALAGCGVWTVGAPLPRLAAEEDRAPLLGAVYYLGAGTSFLGLRARSLDDPRGRGSPLWFGLAAATALGGGARLVRALEAPRAEGGRAASWAGVPVLATGVAVALATAFGDRPGEADGTALLLGGALVAAGGVADLASLRRPAGAAARGTGLSLVLAPAPGGRLVAGLAGRF